MKNTKNSHRLLHDFICEVIIAGEFKDGEIRPVGNYRPDGSYRPQDNYRPTAPKTYLGMTKPEDGIDNNGDQVGDLDEPEGAPNDDNVSDEDADSA